MEVNLLVPLPQTKSGNLIIVIISDRFTTVTQVVPQKRTAGIDVAKAFALHCVFKYGEPKEVLFDNGPQFANKVCYNTSRIFVFVNTFTSASHPQETGHIERFKRSITAILRVYVSYIPENWDEYAGPLTNAYSLYFHSATGARSFELALSRLPPEFKLYDDLNTPLPTGKARVYFASQVQNVIEKALTTLYQSQLRPRFDVDMRLRNAQDRQKVCGWLFMDPSNTLPKPSGYDNSKLNNVIKGSYKVLQLSVRTVVI